MKRKILSLVSAAALLLSLFPLNAFATEPPAYTDVSGHWAETAIESWSARGIIQGADGSFRPDAPITRGELAVIVDRIMKYQTTAQNTFSDLGQAFYTEAMLKANHAGIIKGDGQTMRPMANITREEAVTVLGRALGLTESITGASFDDGAAISAWAAGYVNTAVAKGIIQGHENKFGPKDSITRAQVVTILNNAISAIYSTPGTYTDSATGTVIINTPNVTLKGVTIGGDLIIAEGVGKGDVHLDSVKVEGKTIVRGGGENSIRILGNSQIGVVVIDRQDGKVRVSVEGGADVQIVIVDDGSDDVKIEGTIGTLNIEGSGTAVEVTGKVSEINVAQDATSAALKVAQGATVGAINMAAPNASLSVAGTVTTVTTEATATGAKVATTSTAQITTVQAGAAGTQVTGDGKVTAVKATANNVAVNTPNTKVEAAQGTTGVTAGDKPVTGGSSSTSTPPASGGGGGGGGGGGSTTSTTVKNADELTAALKNGNITVINIGNDITGIDETIKVTRNITINGNGHTLAFTGYNEQNNEDAEENCGILVKQTAATIKNIKIQMNNFSESATPDWQGVYGIQVYDVKNSNVVLENCTLTGGDAGLLVNASKVTLQGTTDVSGNEYGGIEVSMGVGDLNPSNLTIAVNGVVVNTTEAADAPTIWIDGTAETAGTVTNDEAFRQKNMTSQTYYYFADSVYNEEELCAALLDENLDVISIRSNITDIDKTIKIERPVTINGGNHELSFTGYDTKVPDTEQNCGILVKVVKTGEVTLNAVKITMDKYVGGHHNSWQGVYGVQVYDSTGVTLNDYTGAGADAALLVNASAVTLTGVTTVSGNEYGGIEVSKGTVEGLSNATLTLNSPATLVNATECLTNASIWVVNGQGTLTCNLPLMANTHVADGKTHYFLSRPVDLTGAIESESNAFFDTFYNMTSDGSNKVQNQTFANFSAISNANAKTEEENKAAYYVEIGDYADTPDPASAVINGTTYASATAYPVSIGYSNFLELPVWAVEGGKLYVALPYLCVETLPNQDTTIAVGGSTYKVKLYDATVGNLVIGDVVALGTQAGYKNEVSHTDTSASQSSEHGKHYLGLKLKQPNGEALTGAGAYKIFRKNLANNTVGIDVSTTESTYAVYGQYSANPYTVASTKNLNYQLAIPGQGVITVQFNFTFTPKVMYTAAEAFDTEKVLSSFLTATSLTDNTKTVQVPGTLAELEAALKARLDVLKEMTGDNASERDLALLDGITRDDIQVFPENITFSSDKKTVTITGPLFSEAAFLVAKGTKGLDTPYNLTLYKDDAAQNSSGSIDDTDKLAKIQISQSGVVDVIPYSS